MRAAQAGFELKGWHVLAAMITFFTIVISMNVLFVTMAVRTFPGEVAPKSYVQGLRYNQTLADRARQAALGWTAQAEIAAAEQGPALVIRMQDGAGRALDGLTLSGALRRPATDEADIALTFRSLGEGRYLAPAPGLKPGAWRLSVLAVRGEDRLEIGGGVTWTP